MRVNLDSAVFMLRDWLAGLQGSAGSAVFVSSVVARIGVANHETATDHSSDFRGWRLYDRATLGKIRPIVKKSKSGVLHE